MTRRAPREPARGGRLSRERILLAALALVEQAGAEHLTMRRLGEALGVEAMSLYHHVPNREAVVEGIGEVLMARVPPAPPGASWRRACTDFATGLRAVTLAHPQAFRLLGLRPLVTPASLEPVERLLGTLVRTGASPAVALGTYRAVVSFARGYALAEVDGFTVDAAGPGRGLLAALDPERFPVLAGRVDELAAVTPDAAWEAGLAALLDGIAARDFPPEDGRAR